TKGIRGFWMIKAIGEVTQSRLHVSAGNNRGEISKLLLKWQGPERFEIEARNMVGAINFSIQINC
ncbi:hypothetical protein RYX36_025412, partial [Vicia faba]